MIYVRGIFTNRIKLRLQYIGNFEEGVSFIDESGKPYKYYTKDYNSKYFFLNKGEWINVSATIKNDNALFNIREIKL